MNNIGNYPKHFLISIMADPPVCISNLQYYKKAENIVQHIYIYIYILIKMQNYSYFLTSCTEKFDLSR